MKKEVLTVEKTGSAKEGQEHQWTQHKLINTHPSPIRLAESDTHTCCRHSRKLRLRAAANILAFSSLEVWIKVADTLGTFVFLTVLSTIFHKAF